jgi:hypothetical protein
MAKDGLNGVPLPELPPPPARGRTRTLPRNYLPNGLLGLSAGRPIRGESFYQINAFYVRARICRT